MNTKRTSYSLEYKAKLRACYLYTPVLQLPNENELCLVDTKHLSGNYLTDKSYLSLKLLSLLTDDEITYLFQNQFKDADGFDIISIKRNQYINNIPRIVVSYKLINKYTHVYDTNSLLVCYDEFELLSQFEIDYLRERGYALPFMDISVREQVELNWIRLITN